MSKQTISNRLAKLEGKVSDGDHEWEAFISWDAENSHYFKDGIEISQAQYFKEAPKNQPVVVSWGEPIPPRKASHE
jgi:hypothetical protein